MTILHIEVAYAHPKKQKIIALELREGSTVIEAIVQSGIRDFFPEINLETCPTGIFSKAVHHDQILRDRDRIEIYRPLLADPKESRRQRVRGK